MRFRPRGRFDIMFVFDGGGSLRVQSPKDRSLSATEVVANLRHYADSVERGIRAADKKAKQKARP